MPKRFTKDAPLRIKAALLIVNSVCKLLYAELSFWVGFEFIFLCEVIESGLYNFGLFIIFAMLFWCLAVQGCIHNHSKNAISSYFAYRHFYLFLAC